MFSEISYKIKQVEKITGIEPEYFEDIKKLSLELPKIIQAEKDLLIQGQTLRIGVIGQVKSGKSSFLNALLFQGKDLLPKASTPMTAGLTVIGYDEKPKFKVEYYSKEDWNIVESQARQYDAIYKEAKVSGQFEDDKSIEEATKEKAGELICSSKELVEGCGISAKNCIGKEPLEKTLISITDLQGELHRYVGANGEFTSVTKTLYLYLPEEGLKGIEIVDTPGVNDPIVSREERTNEFLRSCHGVFLLSYTGQFCSNTDLTFLKERVYDQGINSVVVLGSKFDSGLIDIARTTDGDLEYAMESLSSSLTDLLKEAFDKKNFRNELPKFHFTSGLCYSLYHKPEKEWDENEIHIAELLIKKYPDFGENRECFRFLGQIEEIKEKYIEKDFKNNKEHIIAERYKDFIDINKSKILNTISETKDDLEDFSKKVKSLNSDNIEKQKNQRSNVERLGKESINLINHTINDINELPRTFLNEVEFPDFKHFYLKPKSFKIEQYNGYWVGSNRYKTLTFDVVDSILLKDFLLEYLNKNLEEVYSAWTKHFSTIGPVAKELKEGIKKALTKDEYSDIDPEILQEVILDSIKNVIRCAKCFSKERIRKAFQKHIDDRIKTPIRNWGCYYSDSTMDPESYIESENEIEQSNYRGFINGILTGYKEELQNEITKQKGAIGEEIDKMKESFETNIGARFAEVTAKYEKAVEEKESKLNALNEGIQGLTEIEQLFTKQYGKQRIETATGILS
jgi:uncharacterized protein YukE